MTLPDLPPSFVPGPAFAAAGGGLDYLEIARNSGAIGISVLVLLLGASAVSWAIIAKKWLQIRRAQDQSARFLETFWQSKRLDAIYQAAEVLSASPISEALIATAMGLFAAIPAVVAYNYFVSKIRILDSEMTNFSNDFLNIVRRHFFS